MILGNIQHSSISFLVSIFLSAIREIQYHINKHKTCYEVVEAVLKFLSLSLSRIIIF